MTDRPPLPPAPEEDPTVPTVLYEPADGFVTITLNRPVVLNAVNRRMQRELYAALGRAAGDEAVRAVILRGAGKAFSAGGDMRESSARVLAGDAPEPADDDDFDTHDLWLRLWGLPKPTIAAVHGHALGFACELAAMCDLTIAAADAKLGEIQIRHGYTPPVLITPFVLGIKQAKEVMLLGEPLLAADAQRLGLVNRVVAPDRLWAEAEALARKFAALPPAAVQQNKQLINRVHELRALLPALQYRDHPAYADAATSDMQDAETQEHLRRLHEQGWEAFKTERDRAFDG